MAGLRIPMDDLMHSSFSKGGSDLVSKVDSLIARYNANAIQGADEIETSNLFAKIDKMSDAVSSCGSLPDYIETLERNLSADNSQAFAIDTQSTGVLKEHNASMVGSSSRGGFFTSANYVTDGGSTTPLEYLKDQVNLYNDRLEVLKRAAKLRDLEKKKEEYDAKAETTPRKTENFSFYSDDVLRPGTLLDSYTKRSGQDRINKVKKRVTSCDSVPGSTKNNVHYNLETYGPFLTDYNKWNGEIEMIDSKTKTLETFLNCFGGNI